MPSPALQRLNHGLVPTDMKNKSARTPAPTGTSDNRRAAYAKFPAARLPFGHAEVIRRDAPANVRQLGYQWLNALWRVGPRYARARGEVEAMRLTRSHQRARCNRAGGRETRHRAVNVLARRQRQYILALAHQDIPTKGSLTPPLARRKGIAEDMHRGKTTRRRESIFRPRARPQRALNSLPSASP
jgi:hypothetical protein